MSETRQARRLRERQGSEGGFARKGTADSAASNRRFLGPAFCGVGVLSLLVAVLLGVVHLGHDREKLGGDGIAAPAAVRADRPPEIADLVKLSDDHLAKTGVEIANLSCAWDLEARKQGDFSRFLDALDRLTAAVRHETARNYRRFISNPAEYEHSDAYYKVGMMITVICKDMGVKYNPAKIQKASLEDLRDQSFYEESEDVFLAGPLGASAMGTCSSMPVLMVAVGRKLGYPLKLAAAKGHLFFRWEDARERRNFECTNAIRCNPDSYYKEWPFPVTDEELAKGWYLGSMSPREELAVFLGIRAAVLNYRGNHEEALKALATASVLKPGHPDLIAATMITSRKRAARPAGGFRDLSLWSGVETEEEAVATAAAQRAIEMSRLSQIEPLFGPSIPEYRLPPFTTPLPLDPSDKRQWHPNQ